MTVSIIIPVYNVEKYLRQCLDSVLLDNHFTGEVICVNDGSTDSSVEILEQYKSKYENITIIDQPNTGLSAARNAGLKKATGDYVLFLDSDDWIGENALQVLSERIAGQDLVCFNGQRYFESTRSFEDADTLEAADYGNGWEYYNHNALLSRHFAFVCVVLRLYRRTFLLQNDLWFKTGIYHEDNEFTPRAFYLAERVAGINDIIYYVYQTQGSITRSVNVKNPLDVVIVMRNLDEFYRKFVKKEDAPVFHRVIAGAMNSALHRTFRLSRDDRKMVNDAYYGIRPLFVHARKSPNWDYRLVGWLYTLFPHHVVEVYKTLHFKF